MKVNDKIRVEITPEEKEKVLDFYKVFSDFEYLINSDGDNPVFIDEEDLHHWMLCMVGEDEDDNIEFEVK